MCQILLISRRLGDEEGCIGEICCSYDTEDCEGSNGGKCGSVAHDDEGPDCCNCGAGEGEAAEGEAEGGIHPAGKYTTLVFALNFP